MHEAFLVRSEGPDENGELNPEKTMEPEFFDRRAENVFILGFEEDRPEWLVKSLEEGKLYVVRR
jgi:hypothetical protein